MREVKTTAAVFYFYRCLNPWLIPLRSYFLHRWQSLLQHFNAKKCALCPEGAYKPKKTATSFIPQPHPSSNRCQVFSHIYIYIYSKIRQTSQHQRCTLPEASPPASLETSSTVTILKSPSMLCFRQLAATANSMIC